MMTIIPDYARYTEFTLEDRLILSDYAWARKSLVTSLLDVMCRRDQLVVSEADVRLIASFNTRIDTIKGTIGEIDESIREIYAEHGRVN